MKKFNDFARHFLFARMILAIGILIILNLVLCFFDSEDPIQLTIFIISIVFVIFCIVAVIFYPKFMNTKFHLLRYDDYLYEIIINYEEWLKTINERIKATNETDLKHFMISKKKKPAPEIMAKLLEEAKANRSEILQGHELDKAEAEEKLNFLRAEKAECVKILFACGIYKTT